MIRRHDTSKYALATRVFSLGLAVWFVGLTVSVHLLHTHPLPPCCPGASTPGEPAVDIDVPLPSEASPGGQVPDLCPVCLFLAKHLADGAAVPPEPIPEDAASARTVCTASAQAASVDWHTATPRAPPL
jgi:hypothetical protein